ncbi:hypothetical protein C0Q70_14719 [Pomacea canaliculata]|uniref:Death domain-containing protein n=1 Tax=Pomacea canaliculata TaxID=400727 RepID=A0A2T7NSW4_POMCA|nr:uncharacterized protein LOC112572381 isoform X2 [Pomacea canaliculata]PVD24248.1 hypothetical protein C0Q70_14719 [Pomacea canaliculata]
MSDEGPKSKEVETLSRASLVHLSRGLGKEPDSLTFPMLLNMPCLRIINFIYDTDDAGLLNDESGDIRTTVVEKCLVKWRELTAGVKPKEQMKTLERALREMGKNELADTLMERFMNNQEITPEVFP